MRVGPGIEHTFGSDKAVPERRRYILQNDFPRTLPDKYFSERRDVKIDVLFQVFQLFGDPTAVAYAAWFN